MLVSFSVENFLSFNSKETFCTEGGRVTKKPEHLIIDESTKKELLCFDAMFGKNGAGKTNFVRAVSTLRNFIVNGKLPQSAPQWWCRLDDKNETLPTVFEIGFIAGGMLYEYSLSVVLSTGTIVQEKLVRVVGNRHTALFFIEEDGSYSFHHSLMGQRNDIEVLSRTFGMSGIPFLFSINHNTSGFFASNPQALVLNTVFRWFGQTLEVIYPEQPLQETSLMDYEIKKDEFARLLKEFDTGIEEIKLEPTTKEKVFENLDIKTQQRLNFQMMFGKPLVKALGKASPLADAETGMVSTVVRNRRNIFIISLGKDGVFHFYALKFVHNICGKKVEFYMVSESDGTHRIFQLIEILMTQQEKVFIMDEISRSLHPKLTIQFIKKYFELTKEKKRRVQLFTTTHETRIMSHDLVRRDEIWIADSNEDGSTKLYSLEDKQVRIDKVLDENYLNGVWGGTPVFMEE